MDCIMDWLKQNPWAVMAIAAWIGERFEALSRENRALLKRMASGIEWGCRHPQMPHAGKEVIANSPEGQSVALNSALDAVSPLQNEQRVSRLKKILNVAMHVIPLLSRGLKLRKSKK